MSPGVPLVLACSALLLGLPARAQAEPTGGTSYTSSARGGTAAQAQASPVAPAPTATTTAPGATTAPVAVPPASVQPDGAALAPAGAPEAVTALIIAANEIASTPYRYGGGHRSFVDTAYDCSGSVSYALHGAGLLGWTLDSTGLSRFGAAGRGTWITIYANKTHTYLVVAGLRFDTSGRAKGGSRWQTATRSSKGFVARHPVGL